MNGPRWPRFGAAALGLLWFLQLGWASTLNPLHTSWLLTGDWRQHWLGFLFFQREPWAFPLGTLSSLLHPVGTNVGFTDSNPLLALFVKPFAPVLPGEFQLIGPWLGLCFALQGYMGALLASTVTKDGGQQLLGGYLFALSPVLLNRVGHDTLCAHWVLLGLLYLGLRDHTSPGSGARALWWATAAVMFAAGTHPYLAAMSWALAIAVAIGLWLTRIVSLGRAAFGIALATAGVVVMWGAIGYLGRPLDGSPGFGEYSSDLHTFVNPARLSRVIPELATMANQHEGFGYLGFGGLAAVLVALVAAIRQRPRLGAAVWTMAGACLILAICAVGPQVKFFGETILRLDWLYEPFLPILNSFRSAGRFIWPLHYLLLLAGLWGVRHAGFLRRPGIALSPQGTTALLALVVLLQTTDLKTSASGPAPRTEAQIATGPYDLARGQYRHLALAPMQILGVCFDPYQEDYTYRFMLLAHRLRLTFNSGIYARLDRKATGRACDELERTIDAGALDPSTIYIVAVDDLPRFQAAGAACGRWDGNWICVARTSNERFAAYVESYKNPR